MVMDPREQLSRMVKSRGQVDAWSRDAFRWVARRLTGSLPHLAAQSVERALARAGAQFWPQSKALLTG